MLNVLIDSSPLANANAHRGVGAYTRFLIQALENRRDIKVWRSSQEVPKDVKIDVVHYPFFDLFFDTLPLRKKAPTVVTIHDVIPLVFPQQYLPGKKGRLKFFKQTLALKSVQAVITDSLASKNDIHRLLRIREAAIHEIPLAANPELQAAPPRKVAEVKELLNLPEKYLLYVGDINYNKNLPQLIKALKYLPDDLHLVLVGQSFHPQNIPEWQWIETQIALSNVATQVHFLIDVGANATETLAAVYTGARAYVQPSLYEGFGLPLLEAMQCKTPVVATGVSSLPEVGGDHAVWAEPTAEGLADGVKTVLDWSGRQRDEVVKSAFGWSQRFTWQKTAAATVKIYQELAKSS